MFLFYFYRIIKLTLYFAISYRTMYNHLMFIYAFYALLIFSYFSMHYIKILKQKDFICYIFTFIFK